MGGRGGGGGPSLPSLPARPSPRGPSRAHDAASLPPRGSPAAPGVPPHVARPGPGRAPRGLPSPRERAHLIPPVSPQTPPPPPPPAARPPPPGAPYGTLGSPSAPHATSAVPATRHLPFPAGAEAAAAGPDPQRGLECAAGRTAGLQGLHGPGAVSASRRRRRAPRRVRPGKSHGAGAGPRPPLPRAPFSRAAPGARSRSPPRRATCRLPLGPIAHAAATPTGSQARAPIGRIRTLALPLHPAVDPAPPPPSAAAPRPAQARLPASSNCVRFWRQTASGSGSPRPAPSSPRPAPPGPRPAPRASRWLHLLGQRRRRRRKCRGRLPGAWATALQAAAPFWVCQTLTDPFCLLSGKVTAALPMIAPRGRRSESGWGGKAVGRDVGSTPAPAENALAPRGKKKPAKAVVVARILCSYSKLDADCVPGTVLSELHEFLLRPYE